MIELLAQHTIHDDWTVVGALLITVSTLVGSLVWVVKRIASDGEKREERAGTQHAAFLESLRRNTDESVIAQKEMASAVNGLSVSVQASTVQTMEMRGDFGEMKQELRFYNDTNRRKNREG